MLLAGIVLGVVLSGEASWADLIDRMMAVVNGRVVTQGDLKRHVEVARLFGDPVADDESALLQEVIENLLILDQIDQFPDLQVEEDRVDEIISQLPDTGSLTPEVLRDAARERLERMTYFDLRFQRFTEATDEEIATYYETVVLPEAVARGLEPMPALNDVGALIAENVITEKADREISAWTDSLIERSEIEVVE